LAVTFSVLGGLNKLQANTPALYSYLCAYFACACFVIKHVSNLLHTLKPVLHRQLSLLIDVQWALVLRHVITSYHA